MRERLRTVGGYSLIVIGIIGLFIPIMPTVPFLLGAAFMLGWEHKAIKPWIGYLEKMKVAKRPGRVATATAGATDAGSLPAESVPQTPNQL